MLSFRLHDEAGSTSRAARKTSSSCKQRISNSKMWPWDCNSGMRRQWA